MAIKTGVWKNCKLEVLDFSEERTVLEDLNDDGSVRDLVMSVDSGARIALRIGNGQVFTATVDSRAVDEVIIPWVQSQCAAGCGRDGSVTLAGGLAVCDSPECAARFKKLMEPELA